MKQWYPSSARTPRGSTRPLVPVLTWEEPQAFSGLRACMDLSHPPASRHGPQRDKHQLLALAFPSISFLVRFSFSLSLSLTLIYFRSVAIQILLRFSMCLL